MALQPAQRDRVRDGMPFDDIAQDGDIDVAAQQGGAVAIGYALDLGEATGQQVLAQARIEIRSLILFSVQVETNNPRPSRDALHSLCVGS
jgi:hypothetical protein